MRIKLGARRLIAVGLVVCMPLAQHSVGLNGVMITVAVALAEAPIGIPLPSGPCTRARIRMRSNTPDASAVTLGS